VSETKPSPSADAVVVIVILARVFFMLVVWLLVFLGIFLGYFTVPILLIGIITAVYLISDFGLFVTLKRRGIKSSERKEFIESITDDTPEKEK
jgi:apolipoprotein N-acyltransferase